MRTSEDIVESRHHNRETRKQCVYGAMKGLRLCRIPWIVDCHVVVYLFQDRNGPEAWRKETERVVVRLTGRVGRRI